MAESITSLIFFKRYGCERFLQWQEIRLKDNADTWDRV